MKNNYLLYNYPYLIIFIISIITIYSIYHLFKITFEYDITREIQFTFFSNIVKYVKISRYSCNLQEILYIKIFNIFL